MFKSGHLIQFVIILLFVQMLLSSCHALVEDEFDNYTQMPVMNALLQADSTFKVQVSLTAALTDSTPVYVDNASVIIESIAEIPDTLIYDEKGWYISPRVVKAGVSYSCKVNIPDYPELSAQTAVPYPTEIGFVLFTDLAGRGEEAEKISSVEFAIPNDRNKKLCWQVELITEGMRTGYDFETGEWTEYFGAENEYLYMLAGQDTVLLNEANPLTLFSNKMMSGNSYKVRFYFNENYTRFSSNVTPYIILKTVDESYYKYMKQYYIYESASWSDIGKTSQQYPLYSNVKNGLGVFTGMSVTKKKLEITD